MKRLSSFFQNQKNLIALSIFLAGLFLGSLFIDFFQLALRSGFSPAALEEVPLVETAGRTWVGYKEPRVVVQVVNDPNCETCNPDQALVWLRRVLPTIEVQPIDANSELGQKIIKEYNITSLPYFLFAETVTKTDFYTEAESLFTKQKNRYSFEGNRLGILPGKYLKLPNFTEEEVVLGDKNAKIAIIEFVDFSCPYCQEMQSILEKVVHKNNQVKLVWKYFPLNAHPKAKEAAEAVWCAGEQGKGFEMGSKLFAIQKEWADRGPEAITLARSIQADTRVFAQCLASNRFLEKLDADLLTATEYNINGTPALLVGNIFVPGVISEEELQAIIEKELAQ